MKYFCTLFDSFYFHKGMAMYESLIQHMPDAFLYVFAFDELTLSQLKLANLPNMKVISLAEFEDEALLKVKSTRSKAEYCWTCTPSTIYYLFQKYKLPHCAYLDADIYFFSNPKVLFDELKDKSVMITEHRYTPRYDYSKASGKYCVQFMYFVNNSRGVEVVTWWRNACLEWCYARIEEGRFGDQKYLDDWCERFSGVHELQHLGGGVAPWNVQQYTIFMKNKKCFGKELANQREFPVVFYHFHALKLFFNKALDFGDYALDSSVKNIIYLQYLQHLQKIECKYQAVPISNYKLSFFRFIVILARRLFLKRVWNFHCKINFLKRRV